MLWYSIFLGFLVLTFLLAACETGQLYTDKFMDISDQFEQLKWYLLTVDTQRILPTILIGLHQPFVFECYGIVACSREQFKKVNSEIH